ncbi:MAG: hypothetical protein KAR21_22745, partial [Spirochaetales bacterium]|nr:hypothetical protein [Spirochaetales bacterium]
MKNWSKITAIIILETFIFSLLPLAALEPPPKLEIPVVAAAPLPVEVFSGTVTPEEGAVLNLGSIT